MYATDFEFAGEKLSDYGMMICRFDNSGGLETVSSGADITFNQVRSTMSNRFNLYPSTYDSSYTTTFQICKNPCMVENQNEIPLSTAEISSLQRWLCRRNQYYRFKIYQDGYEHLYWNSTFSSKQIELNGNVIGMELTLYTDAPFAFMDEIIVEKDCSEILTFDIYDASDEEGFIYPNIEIMFLQDGDFQLQNSLSRKITKIYDCKNGEKITLHGNTHIIESTSQIHDLSKNFNYFFPKIINTYTDNKNTFTCNLKCNIVLSYSPIRKVGL